MSDDAEKKDIGPLPPKLDLRKSGIVKPGSAAPRPEKADGAGTGSETVPSGQPVSGQGAATARPSTPAATPANSEAGPTAAKADTLRIKIPEAKPAGLSSSAPTAADATGGVTPRITPDSSKPGNSAPKPEEKKQTSRIPLESAQAPASGAGPAKAPKTIRIKPSPMMIRKPSGGAESKGPAVAPSPDAAASAAKRQTSRISLEDALSSEGSEEKGGTTPKTIKLKRLSEAPTVKVTPQPSGVPKPGDAAPEKAETQAKPAMSKTARLDEAVSGEEAASPTKRKTIRVKRPPGAAAGVKGVAITRPSVASAGAGATAATPQVTEQTSWVFPVVTLLSVLIIGIAIYVLAAQAVDGVALAWPGQIVTP